MNRAFGWINKVHLKSHRAFEWIHAEHLNEEVYWSWLWSGRRRLRGHRLGLRVIASPGHARRGRRSTAAGAQDRVEGRWSGGQWLGKLESWRRSMVARDRDHIEGWWSGGRRLDNAWKVGDINGSAGMHDRTRGQCTAVCAGMGQTIRIVDDVTDAYMTAGIKAFATQQLFPWGFLQPCP
jgi:hypothetical protein